MSSDAAWFVDDSLTLSGSSEQAVPEDQWRSFFAVQNPEGNNHIGVNLTGGEASIGSTGTLILEAGDSIFLNRKPPKNAVNVIGTSGQLVVFVTATG